LRITFECGLNSSAGCFRVNTVNKIELIFKELNLHRLSQKCEINFKPVLYTFSRHEVGSDFPDFASRFGPKASDFRYKIKYQSEMEEMSEVQLKMVAQLEVMIKVEVQ